MLLLRFQILSVLLLLYNSSNAEEDTAEVAVESALTEETCGRKRAGCCAELFLGDEDDMLKCFTLHQNKLPKEGESDPAVLIAFLSCFVECQYKQRKYIGKGDNINMKMVKNDAEKTFEGRPKERDYHIAMFDFCRKDALTIYSLIKTNPGARIMFRDACKPFFTFVYLCTAEYHKKKTCPYFRWEGARNSPNEEQCKDAKEKCYAIDKIVI